jgi:hypothetical protein
MDINTPNDNVEISEALRDQCVTEMASLAHDDWRAPRKQEDGSYEPRIKGTDDQAWIDAHDGQTECDIANTSYVDLPSNWQAENKASAEVAIDAVIAADQAGEPLNAAFIERASSDIHDSWLARNDWAKGGDLDKPFADLPEEEKEKDRIFIKRAIEIVMKNS